MADEFMSLSGFRELAAALRELGPRVAKNALRRSVSSGAAVIRDAAKSNAPEDTGKLKRAIGIKRSKDARGEMSAKYQVFVRQAKNGSIGQKNVKAYGKFDAFYARWIEFGTSKMPAQPFLRPAFESQKENAVESIKEKLTDGVQKAAEELGRR